MKNKKSDDIDLSQYQKTTKKKNQKYKNKHNLYNLSFEDLKKFKKYK
jgi:hypothetical protein